jgi:broad specificity phosphatase PhoE
VDDDRTGVRRVDGTRDSKLARLAAEDGEILVILPPIRTGEDARRGGQEMTTRLNLLCHASTSAVRTHAFPVDEPLDPQGRQKLAVVPHRLRHSDRCFTSPALRASQTGEALGLGATVEPALRDCDYGTWTGRSLDDVQAQDPKAVAEWIRNPEAAPHGGESIVALMARVSGWLEVQKAAPGMIVAITHASVIRAAIVCALEAEPRSFWHIDIAPLSLTKLSANNGRWTLVSMSSGKADARADNPAEIDPA